MFRSACRKSCAEWLCEGAGSTSGRDGKGSRRRGCCCGEQFYEIPHVLDPPIARTAQLLPGPIDENSGFVLAPRCKPSPPGQRLQFPQGVESLVKWWRTRSHVSAAASNEVVVTRKDVQPIRFPMPDRVP